MLSMLGARAPTMPAAPFSTPRYLRALAIRYSASASIGPPMSARSLCRANSAVMVSALCRTRLTKDQL